MVLRELVREGWTRRSVDCDPRLSEAVAMYEALGHEVLLVSVLEECGAEGGTLACSSCYGADANPERYKVIYSRPKTGAKAELDELYD
jgi:hypothetical protein